MDVVNQYHIPSQEDYHIPPQEDFDFIEFETGTKMCKKMDNLKLDDYSIAMAALTCTPKKAEEQKL